MLISVSWYMSFIAFLLNNYNCLVLRNADIISDKVSTELTIKVPCSRMQLCTYLLILSMGFVVVNSTLLTLFAIISHTLNQCHWSCHLQQSSAIGCLFPSCFLRCIKLDWPICTWKSWDVHLTAWVLQNAGEKWFVISFRQGNL